MNNQLIDLIHEQRAGLNALEVAAQEAKNRERVHLALLDWLLAGNTSPAEQYMIKVALGIDTPIVYPASYPEFAGCYKLRAAIPEIAEKLLRDGGWVSLIVYWQSLWAKEVTLKEVLGDKIP